MAIESIEKQFGSYEAVLFLAGLTHDYAKLYNITKPGEKKIREILKLLLDSEAFVFEFKNAEMLIEKLISSAVAVEGTYEDNLDENFIQYIVPIVRLADDLMSLESIDKAISYLITSKEFMKLSENYNIKFSFIKTPIPSIIQAKISESVINIVSMHKWIPLVVYPDGIILIGDGSSGTVSLREIVEVIQNEISSALSPSRLLVSHINRLKRLSLTRIYRRLIQSEGTITPVDYGSLKNNKESQEVFYHNTIVKYLNGTPIVELDREIRKIKNQERIGSIIDPRRLATGGGDGSTYFEEVLGTIVISKEGLIDFILSIENDEDLFLIVSYMVAFASEDIRIIMDILKTALEVDVPNIDKELIRIIAVAEVYKYLGNSNIIRKLVSTVFEKLGGIEEIDHYIKKFVLSKIKSNIVNTEKISTLDILGDFNKKSYGNYCRICGEPILKSAISFKQYADVIGASGGASEIWLHDDLPLANLEDIATNKKTKIRYICPLCYYEAEQLRGEYKPPFFVIALHPVVSYDLWQYMKERLSLLSDIYLNVKKGLKIDDIENAYMKVLSETNLKITSAILEKLKLKQGGETIILFDSLGARVYLPLEEDLSLKKRTVAYVLALTPFVMSLSGGGQIGLVATFGDAFNLGTEVTPVFVPHSPSLVLSIVKEFEKVKRFADMQKRKMNPDEYAIYNLSYITILKSLLIYGLRIFAWYNKWRRMNKDKEINDYVLAMYEYMESIPHVSLALSSPPPERLDPRKGDEEELPKYSLISKISQEVELYMSQANKIIKGEELSSLNKLLYSYAIALRELENELGIELRSRYKVQKPLRKAIDIMLEYAIVLSEDDAKGVAKDNFLQLMEASIGKDLESVKKKIKDEHGNEKEISYEMIFFGIFNNLADLIFKLRRELPSSKLNKFIEIMLDSAYEKYKSIKV